jgi:hypothetical protein
MVLAANAAAAIPITVEGSVTFDATTSLYEYHYVFSGSGLVPTSFVSGFHIEVSTEFGQQRELWHSLRSGQGWDLVNGSRPDWDNHGVWLFTTRDQNRRPITDGPLFLSFETYAPPVTRRYGISENWFVSTDPFVGQPTYFGTVVVPNLDLVGFYLTVPEPGTLALMALGALILRSRKHRRSGCSACAAPVSRGPSRPIVV